MTLFRKDIEEFRAARLGQEREARQRVAFRLMAGIDLEAAFAAAPAERQAIAARLKRLLERERLKGLTKHWSYDLNRHIALAQAVESLTAEAKTPQPRTRRRNAPRRGWRNVVRGGQALRAAMSGRAYGKVMAGELESGPRMAIIAGGWVRCRVDERKANRRSGRPLRGHAITKRLSGPCACGRGPSSWPAASVPPRSSAPPWGSSRRGPTSRGTGRASGRNGSSGDASAT